ncbi:type VI secretion system tip protein VgrG [Lutimonas halocynthiae]|uniref:type VI secretion system tip protein VgrG n=1 Tax=Lutimonas halocynthiae TaxID=1446477 RepID=UPI0025B35F5D|nr:type VI secretion system tip protein VgrG [Lutimonas halocynthiae]MDN3643358.1 type VI secretion system tip protein VgrG [Lutimonas halocynthiae]
MSVSPLIEETNLISFNILSNGKDIPSTYEVLKITVRQQINKISEAVISLNDGNTANQTFDITDSDNFKPGSEIEIKLGYHNKNNSVFKGVVIKQIIKVDGTSGSQLQVICKDKSIGMTINRKNAIYSDMKDSAVMEEIIGKYSLSTSIDSTNAQHKEIIQYYATDWDFIVNRAEINGMIVLTESGKLLVQKPDVSSSPALQVQFGYDIIEFDGEIDATHQYSGIQGNAWDMSSQAVINATAKEPSVNDQGDLSGSDLAKVLNSGTKNLNSSASISQEDIQSWADAGLLKSRLSRFIGNITFQGSWKAKINSTIKLMGLGKRFNGNAFISGLTHTIDQGNWNTEVNIGLSPDWFVERNKVEAPEASGLIPGIKGLQTGIVKKTYEDPDNQFRIQVEIPILGEDGKSVWARLSNFYTGNSFGAYFLPEVNDEVILGFMNDDPRFPIILGSVYSSSIPAPETPDEKNTIKTLITQSKLQIKFDEENKVITILSPEGNSICLSEEDKGIIITDQNENKIEMNDQGIVIESKSNMTLKAAEEVKIEGSSIKVSGTESIDNTGGSVSITGNESTTIKGSAQCDISSDGQVNIKGLAVMINS